MKKQLGEDVFCASQWAVMRGWVEAVRKDVIWAATVTTAAHKSCERVHQSQEEQELEQKKTVKSLTDQLAVIKSQLEAEKSQSKYLKHQVEEINTSLERRIKYSKGLKKTIEQRLELLKESMKYLKNGCSQLQNTYRSFRTFVKSTFLHESKNILHMKTYIMQTMKQVDNYLNEKIHNEQRQQRDILVITALLDEKKTIIKELETVKSSLIQENGKLNDNLLTLKESITERNQQLENVEELKLKIGSLEKTLEESKLREQLYRAKIESSDQPILD
ncbi:hypothetical protein J6590_088615 [Homalodisca vitripennis]|nr:hypothetical protein J6590_088615 [Homalodisca vitripennis]